MAEKDEKNELSRREIRRRRRKRNQIIAYVSVSVSVIVILCGVIFGVRAVAGIISDKKQEASWQSVWQRKRRLRPGRKRKRKLCRRRKPTRRMIC